MKSSLPPCLGSGWVCEFHNDRPLLIWFGISQKGHAVSTSGKRTRSDISQVIYKDLSSARCDDPGLAPAPPKALPGHPLEGVLRL
jgi:hypothetical protein